MMPPSRPSGGYHVIEHPFLPLETTTVWVSIATKLPVACLKISTTRGIYVYNLPVPELVVHTPNMKKLLLWPRPHKRDWMASRWSYLRPSAVVNKPCLT